MGSTQIVVGEYEISVVDDHIGLRRNPGDVFVDVSSAEWDPHRDYALTPDGCWEAQWRAHLIRRSDAKRDNILVDTGMGPGPYEHGPPQGDLLTNLENLGIAASDVNNVVTTHCHGDHIGWNMQGDGDSASTTFPNATYHIAQNDWTYYIDPANENDIFDTQVAPLESTGQLKLVRARIDGRCDFSRRTQCVLVRAANCSAHRRPIPQRDSGAALVSRFRLANRSSTAATNGGVWTHGMERWLDINASSQFERPLAYSIPESHRWMRSTSQFARLTHFVSIYFHLACNGELELS